MRSSICGHPRCPVPDTMVDVHGDVDIARLRRDYRNPPLDVAHMADDPLVELARWVDAAAGAGVTEPNAMTVATVGPDGAPAARVVLLRGIDDGLVFYTNYHSAKGRDLAADPRAAAVLWWVDLPDPGHRQVLACDDCTERCLLGVPSHGQPVELGGQSAEQCDRQR
jgi:hypothetical protein